MGVGLGVAVGVALGAAVVVEQVAGRRTLPIVEVAGPDAPHHQPQQRGGEQDRGRDRDGQEAHGSGCQRSSRTALPVTITEERLMATAASRGVSTPAAASGIATRL